MKKKADAKPDLSADEIERLNALRALNVLDTPPELAFDEITNLASRICGTPISLISLIDEDRQWFKSKVGLNANETPRDISFCSHAILNQKTLIIEDAHLDTRFQNNPFVLAEPKIRFYAGSPLVTSDGYSIGTLCVIDHKPRRLTADQISSLEILSRQVVLNFERNKIERELTIQKKFFGSIVSVLPQLVSYVDLNYNYLFRNAAYQKWFNLTPQDLNKVSMQEIIGEKSFVHVKPYLDKTFAGIPQHYETSLKLEINNVFFEKQIQANYIPDFDAEGHVRGLFAVVNDLTEIKAKENLTIEQGKKLEVALCASQASEKTFRAYFENSVVGMIKLNSKLKFVDANPAYLKLMEYSLDELQNMTLADVTHPDDRDWINKKIFKSANENKPLIRHEKRNLTKTGKIVYLQVSGQAIEVDQSGDYQLFIMIQDISELKAAENLVQEHQIQLIQNSKMSALGEMAGGVAHEINNPLAIILGKLDHLKLIYQSDRENESLFLKELEKIYTTAVRIGKIVMGLRAFSRDGSDDPSEPVKINSIISNAIALCSEKFAIQGVKLHSDFNSDTKILCRSTDVCQILLNLLNNAFDALQLEDEKWIKIEVSIDDTEVASISVTDSGKGISKAIQDKIMQSFFTTKEVGKGTGLGLSISKGLAQANGGELFLDTNSLNTKFIVQLPLDQSASTGKAS
ncbi:MAG: PAS domain S-box protein [Bdellovibrio sp.]|nr:PAS domain S-box protein [Bdellovibrio sp.]